MSGVARSQRLLSYTFAEAGNSPALTCPADRIILVKTMFAWAGGAAVNQLIGIVQAQQPSAGIAYFVGDVPLSEVVYVERWLVLNPTDGLYFYSDTAGAVVYVNGAVLSGAPQIVPAELVQPQNIPPLAAALPFIEAARKA